MKYRKFSGIERDVSVLGLGTWAFAGDEWWGSQKESDSIGVLERAVELGINLIDTAPAYGWGRAEKVVGKFLKKTGARKKIVLATKLGLDKRSPTYKNLRPERMREEIEQSFDRLGVDFIDIYQIHWPDPDVPISESAPVMKEFLDKGLIGAVGVSNYNVSQMKEFMKYSPLHSLQPPYSMFRREIEKDILPFCIENNLSVIVYSPLHGGVLTGKFHLDGAKIPEDERRKNIPDLKEPAFSRDKKILEKLREIANRYGKTLAQFALNWTFNQKGITTILVGARNIRQLKENINCTDFEISQEHLKQVEELLSQR